MSCDLYLIFQVSKSSQNYQRLQNINGKTSETFRLFFYYCIKLFDFGLPESGYFPTDNCKRVDN